MRERKLDLQKPGNGDGNQYRRRQVPGVRYIFAHYIQSGIVTDSAENLENEQTKIAMNYEEVKERVEKD